MRPFTRWVVGVFASPVGVIVLAALDSTLFFNLPLGIDAVVIILAARSAHAAWAVPLLATAGAVGGAWLTFWMGMKAGEKGLDRYASGQRLERIRARIRNSGAVALAVLDLIPPPFPFTLFVLAAGALEVNAARFFVTLTVCRLFRFGLEAALAVVYGSTILRWLESDLFHQIVAFFILLAIALTTLSIVRLSRAPRSVNRPRAAA
jgi:membrane protein YqaA with SNARE-associated domain